MEGTYFFCSMALAPAAPDADNGELPGRWQSVRPGRIAWTQQDVETWVHSGGESLREKHLI